MQNINLNKGFDCLRRILKNHQIYTKSKASVLYETAKLIRRLEMDISAVSYENCCLRQTLIELQMSMVNGDAPVSILDSKPVLTLNNEQGDSMIKEDKRHMDNKIDKKQYHSHESDDDDDQDQTSSIADMPLDLSVGKKKVVLNK